MLNQELQHKIVGPVGFVSTSGPPSRHNESMFAKCKHPRRDGQVMIYALLLENLHPCTKIQDLVQSQNHILASFCHNLLSESNWRNKLLDKTSSF